MNPSLKAMRLLLATTCCGEPATLAADSQTLMPKPHLSQLTWNLKEQLLSPSYALHAFSDVAFMHLKIIKSESQSGDLRAGFRLYEMSSLATNLAAILQW